MKNCKLLLTNKNTGEVVKEFDVDQYSYLQDTHYVEGQPKNVQTRIIQSTLEEALNTL